jgi:hypothetical protein
MDFGFDEGISIVTLELEPQLQFKNGQYNECLMARLFLVDFSVVVKQASGVSKA